MDAVNSGHPVTTVFYIAGITAVGFGALAAIIGLAAQWRFLDLLLFGLFVMLVSFMITWAVLLLDKRTILSVIAKVQDALDGDDEPEPEREELPAATNTIDDSIKAQKINGVMKYSVQVRGSWIYFDERTASLLRHFIEAVWVSGVDARRQTWMIAYKWTRDDWEMCDHALDGWALVNGAQVKKFQDVIAALIKKGVFAHSPTDGAGR